MSKSIILYAGDNTLRFPYEDGVYFFEGENGTVFGFTENNRIPPDTKKRILYEGEKGLMGIKKHTFKEKSVRVIHSEMGNYRRFMILVTPIGQEDRYYLNLCEGPPTSTVHLNKEDADVFPELSNQKYVQID